MTPEEITKLAESLCPTNNPTMDDVWLIEDIIEGILRTHCIVEKSKVREMHTALSKEMSILNNWEEREIFKARISMLYYLFGKDLFSDNDKT